MSGSAPSHDPERLEILVDKLGGVIREHMAASRGSVTGIQTALNALASVAGLTVTGAMSRFPSAPQFFRTALAAQIDRNLSNKGPTT